MQGQDQRRPIGVVREKVARLYDLTHVGAAAPPNGFQTFETTTGSGHWRRRSSYVRAWMDIYLAVVRIGAWQGGAVKLANAYAIALRARIYDTAVVDAVAAAFVRRLNTL